MKEQVRNETAIFGKDVPVFPLLASMAFPMVLSMLVNSLYNIVDSFFVAQISEDAMTALSLVYPVQNLINAIAVGFGVGMNAVISYYLGAGEERNAEKAAAFGLTLSVIHGIVIQFVSIAAMPHFLRLFTSSENVIEMGIRYSTIAFSFSIAITVGLVFEKMFQAVGRMNVSMAALLCGCVVNIILDPLLIFGIGIFPKMGIDGAALATGIGQIVSLMIYAAVFRFSPPPIRIRREDLTGVFADRKMGLKLYAIGIPATLNLALPSFLISCLNWLLSLYSQSYVVVLGIYYKLQTFLYLPANGIVQGMRPVIGFYFGAGEWKRVSKVYQTALWMSAAIMALGTVICLTSAGPLIALFTDDLQTIAAGQEALRIISAGFIVSSVSVVSSGALEGLGKGVPSLMISLCRYGIFIIPASMLLCRIWGACGVWNAFWVTEAAAAVLSGAIYRRTIRAAKMQ